MPSIALIRALAVDQRDQPRPEDDLLAMSAPMRLSSRAAT